jgi:hypothetical protein
MTTVSSRSTYSSAVVSAVRKALWCLGVILLMSAADTLQAQTVTESVLARMLDPATNISDQRILDALKGCIAFVPTEARVARLARIRPGLAPKLQDQLPKTCLGPSPDSTKNFPASGDDVLWLSKRELGSEIIRLVHSCPAPAGSTIRELAASGALDTVVQHVGDLCRIDLSPPLWLIGVHTGVSPLYAAKQIQQESMDFTSGWAFEGRIARRVSPGAVMFIRLAYNSYGLDLPEMDDVRATSFKHLMPSAGVRVIGSCVVRRFCGAYALGRNDAFLDVDLAWSWLTGDAAPAQFQGRNIHFKFDGPSIGLRGGYLRRLSHSLDLEFSAGYRVIGFRSVRVATIDREFKDNLGGASGEVHFGMTVQYGVSR